jgi:hypothetical protein
MSITTCERCVRMVISTHGWLSDMTQITITKIHKRDKTDKIDKIDKIDKQKNQNTKKVKKKVKRCWIFELQNRRKGEVGCGVSGGPNHFV